MFFLFDFERGNELVAVCGEFLDMILDIFKFHGVDIHSEFLQMFNCAPVRMMLIGMCMK